MNGLVKWRFRLVITVVLGSALFILARYGAHMVQGNEGPAAPSLAQAERGNILDRNGKVLASQIMMYNVYVSPPSSANAPVLAAELAPIVEMRAEDIQNDIDMAGGRFLLKSHVPLAVMEMIRDEQENGRLAGVTTMPIPVRVYPEKNLASQIIGFAGSDNNGREGVEYAFNNELSGGSNVTLTIDINVQHILEKVAASTQAVTQAESVMFLAMDPRNGEILGSAVLPDFDPNNYQASSSDTYLNLAAREHYEPGSVFKIFSIAALMNAGVVSENTEFVCNGVYERVFPGGERVRIECADGVAHGRVRPRDIIRYSCNVGTAYAAERLENQAFYEALLNFGFGEKTGAWVNAATAKAPLIETAGLLKNPGTPGLWSGRTRQSIAFGQEIAVSALQVIQAASVIANDGAMVPPKIVAKIAAPDGTTTVSENRAAMRRQIIRPEVAHQMLSYMADTASLFGTGWRADVEGLMAVKTGTSQIWASSGGGYSKTDFIASCLALLPVESPSLMLYCVIIKPRGETYGGRIAAPAIREAGEQLINYLGIPRPSNPIVTHSGRIDLPEQMLPVIGPSVPDFSGLAKKTLLPLLLRDDLHVEIVGEGWVRRQSPPPGTAMTADTVIELILE